MSSVAKLLFTAFNWLSLALTLSFNGFISFFRCVSVCVRNVILRHFLCQYVSYRKCGKNMHMHAKVHCHWHCHITEAKHIKAHKRTLMSNVVLIKILII